MPGSGQRHCTDRGELRVLTILAATGSGDALHQIDDAAACVIGKKTGTHDATILRQAIGVRDLAPAAEERSWQPAQRLPDGLRTPLSSCFLTKRTRPLLSSMRVRRPACSSRFR